MRLHRSMAVCASLLRDLFPHPDRFDGTDIGARRRDYGG